MDLLRGGGACRGSSSTDIGLVGQDFSHSHSLDKANCRDACLNSPSCVAIEVKTSGEAGHCELWTSVPQHISSSETYQCYVKPPGFWLVPPELALSCTPSGDDAFKRCSATHYFNMNADKGACDGATLQYSDGGTSICITGHPSALASASSSSCYARALYADHRGGIGAGYWMAKNPVSSLELAKLQISGVDLPAASNAGTMWGESEIPCGQTTMTKTVVQFQAIPGVCADCSLGECDRYANIRSSGMRMMCEVKKYTRSWATALAPSLVWTQDPFKLGPYNLRYTSSGKCVYPYGGSAAAGTKLVLHTGCDVNSQLAYTLKPAGKDTGTPAAPAGAYFLLHHKSSLCWYPKDGALEDNTQLVLETCDLSSSLFHWVPVFTSIGPEASFYLKHKDSQRCIHPSGGNGEIENVGLVLYAGCVHAFSMLNSGDTAQDTRFVEAAFSTEVRASPSTMAGLTIKEVTCGAFEAQDSGHLGLDEATCDAAKRALVARS